MKKIIILSFALLLSLAVFSQRERVLTAPYDSVLAVETVYTGTIELKGFYNSVTIQGLCTEVGGTSDGTLIFQGSVDGTSYQNLAPVTGLIDYFPNNDTLTIVDGAVQHIMITGNPFNFYRWKATGTANDSTLITTTYTYK